MLAMHDTVIQMNSVSAVNSVFYYEYYFLREQYFLRCYSAVVWKMCLPFVCKATEQRASGVLSGPSCA